MTELLRQLNTRQQEAVTTTNGPVLVLAGAGSGKTRALTHRVAYLIQEKNVSLANILAVTFTNKAANEMSNRVAHLLDQNSKIENQNNNSKSKTWQDNQKTKLPWLGTFHRICVLILRREAHHLGYDRSFTIYDEQDSQAVIKKIIKEMKLDPKRTSPSAVSYFISSAKAELMDPDHYRKLAAGNFQRIVSEVYIEYEKRLKRAEAMDFDDLILNCVKLFRENPEILQKYQRQFKYILIDEYQDTNHAQYIWAKLLANSHHNICVVGDDFQSIYSWRGANFRNILDFEKDYPEAKVIKMEQNYRSTQSILSGAQGVIDKNQNRTNKKLWTENQEGLPITVYEALNDRDEADFVVREIKALKLSSDTKYSDYAILYRTNAQSRIFEETLIRYEIPYQIIGGVSFYQRREVKDIVAYLRLVFNPNDLVSLERIINVPARGIGEVTAAKILGEYQKTNILRAESSPLDGVKDQNDTEKIKNSIEQISSKAGIFIEMIGDLRKYYKEHNVVELIDYIARRSGYKEYLLDGTPEGETRWENVMELQNLAAGFLVQNQNSNGKDQNLTTGRQSDQSKVKIENQELVNIESEDRELTTDDSLADFLERVSLYQDSENLDKNRDAVILMTLHAAKGLEFDTIFITGMEEGIFPHSRSLSDQDQLEEERRLCYVGMTRAKKRLYLLYAVERLFHGNIMTSVPSRFIGEVPADYIDMI